MDPLAILQLSLTDQIIQYAAWLLALIELTLTFYVLLLNPRHPANRFVALLLLWNAINCFAAGQLIGASTASAAYLPTILLAITIPTVIPLLVVITIVLFKPAWLYTERTWLQRYRFGWWITMLVFVLPIILVLVDVIFGPLMGKTRLYFTGLDPYTYTGGFVTLPAYAAGMSSSVIRVLYYGPVFLILNALLVYFGLLDRGITRSNRILARLLLVGVLISGAAQFITPKSWPSSLPGLISSTCFAIAYGYGCFQQMISERRTQPGNLQIRLAALVIVISVPMLIAVVFFVTSRTNTLFEKETINFLVSANRALKAETRLWIDTNSRILQNLARQPGIQSMQADLQGPILKSTARSFPYMNLISTIDLTGQTVVRSDDQITENFADQDWFKATSQGMSIYFQASQATNEAGRTNAFPSVVVAVPIFNESDEVSGVLMFRSELYRISDDLSITTVTQQARLVTSEITVFLVDSQGYVISHPNKSYAASLYNMSTFAPVAALTQGKTGIIVNYVALDGKSGRAYIDRLSNGWGVVAQQPESAAKAPLGSIQQAALVVLLIGITFLSLLVWLTIRQSLQPIKNLTQTASAITAGELDRTAPVESEDELGVMAQAFNKMTAQLRELISGLEQRVEERTADLTRRSGQLEAAAQVARQAAAIPEVQDLLNQTALLIARHFGYYHVGIFLIDNVSEYAVLQASNSEGGQRMLMRNHKLKVGQIGIVGNVAETGLPRIALDVGGDAVFFNNPDLPKTRSEIALPLKIQDQVIGVLDVQSTEPSAFVNEDIDILQILADQIALAVNNARLLKNSQETLKEIQILYGRQTRHNWEERLRGAEGREGIAYRYNALDVVPVEASAYRPEGQLLQPVVEKDQIQVPIALRGQVLGSLSMRRGEGQSAWTSEELGLVEEMVSQVVPALENARLLEQIQERAQFERGVSELSNRIQGSLDLQTVMKTAVEEIGRVIHAEKIEIRLAGQKLLTSEAPYQLPLTVRGDTVALLEVWPEQGRNLVQGELDFLNGVQDRLAQAIDSARLFQETQVVARREQTLNQIVSRLSRSLDLDSLLQSAVRELSKIQAVNELSIHIRSKDALAGAIRTPQDSASPQTSLEEEPGGGAPGGNNGDKQ